MYNKFISNLTQSIQDIKNGTVVVAEKDSFYGYILSQVKTFTSIDIFIHDDKHKYTKAGGEFFKYYNNTDLDLSEYGIFHSLEESEKDICLIEALK